MPVHIYTSEPQSTPEQEGPQAALDDVVAEVVRLRTQFQQFIVEREAERVHGECVGSAASICITTIWEMELASHRSFDTSKCVEVE